MSVHRMPRPGLIRHSKKKGSIFSSKNVHSIRPMFKSSKSKPENEIKTKKKTTFFAVDADMSNFEDFSDSDSFKDVISNWKKSRSSASSKRIEHSSTDKSSDEDRTIWTETSSLDSKKALSETETTSRNTTTKKETASNTTKSYLQKNHKKTIHKKVTAPKLDVNNCHFSNANAVSTNANGHPVRTKDNLLEGQNANAGDTKFLTVETISEEMERLKDMAQMMSEMNKRLSGENDAMMELMRSVQPRAKELMDQLRRERKEASDLQAMSMRSSKDHAQLKTELNKLRVDLFSEKEKFSTLKSQVVQLRSQYVTKVNKLQQLKRNTKKLINRYREFKEEHSMCGEEREMLKTKLVEVVSKFEKMKNIASQFQEGGSIANKLHDLQREKSELQDERARLESRVRDYEDLEKRMKKMETDATNMVADYEGDLERLRGLLEEKETTLSKLEREQVNMRQENALLTKDVKRLTEEHEIIKQLLESKDTELEDTKSRLTLQDENIRKLQDAYLQMTTRLSETRSNSNDREKNQTKNNATNTNSEYENTIISKDIMGKVESVINDVTDRTYSLRKTPNNDRVEEASKLKFNMNTAAQRKESWKDAEERRTMRKILRSSPVYESKSPGTSLRNSERTPKLAHQNVMKQFDEETQTDELHRAGQKEPTADTSTTIETKKHSERISSQRFRTLARPIAAKERTFKSVPLARSGTKNNNSSYRYAHGRNKIWRLCRAHDPVFRNMVPSRCAIVDNHDPIRFKFKSNPTKDGGSLYGKLDKVFEAIRVQEDGIERLKSQLDLICESSQIDDNLSDISKDEN